MRVEVMDLQNLPAILTVEEVRRALRLSRAKAYELVHRQGFPAIRFGRTIRVPRDAFIRWLEAQAA
jgi:excisionase family DNA binding protein